MWMYTNDIEPANLVMTSATLSCMFALRCSRIHTTTGCSGRAFIRTSVIEAPLNAATRVFSAHDFHGVPPYYWAVSRAVSWPREVIPSLGKIR